MAAAADDDDDRHGHVMVFQSASSYWCGYLSQNRKHVTRGDGEL